MAPRAEGLLEEAQKEAEEVVAEAEVISLLGEWMLGTCYSISLVCCWKRVFPMTNIDEQNQFSQL